MRLTVIKHSWAGSRKETTLANNNQQFQSTTKRKLHAQLSLSQHFPFD